MEISNIIIEKRPRLQCANFFITFTSNFVEADAVKLNVTSEKLIIKLDDNREFLVRLSDHFQLHTKTLSQLIIKKNYVSFRINTNTEDFSSELLHVENGVNNNAFTLNLQLKSDTNYKIKCSNCTNVLTENVSFSRILELPSENMDISEWFCHKHNDTQTCEEENSSSQKFFDDAIDEKYNSSKFKPGLKDIFYGNYFGLFNTKHFKNLRTKGKLTYCKRCFQFLGELTNLKYKDSIKLWNDTITFETISDNDETTFLFDNKSLLKNFIFILCKLQHDFTFELFGLPQLFKVIFEATMSDGKKNFLLLQVMDHNLEMLRLVKASDETIPSQIVLEKCKTVKLLFKFEEDEEQPLVKFWLSNTNINSVQISLQMFMAAVEYLTKMSSLIPECYRTSYGFVLSYLDM